MTKITRNEVYKTRCHVLTIAVMNMLYRFELLTKDDYQMKTWDHSLLNRYKAIMQDSTANDLVVFDKLRTMLIKLDICHLDWSMMMHYCHMRNKNGYVNGR